VQGECKPNLLEFAEPQPRFNEVTLNTPNLVFYVEKGWKIKKNGFSFFCFKKYYYFCKSKTK